jgi:hypothetical protein
MQRYKSSKKNPLKETKIFQAFQSFLMGSGVVALV